MHGLPWLAMASIPPGWSPSVCRCIRTQHQAIGTRTPRCYEQGQGVHKEGALFKTSSSKTTNITKQRLSTLSTLVTIAAIARPFYRCSDPQSCKQRLMARVGGGLEVPSSVPGHAKAPSPEDLRGFPRAKQGRRPRLHCLLLAHGVRGNLRSIYIPACIYGLHVYGTLC